MMGLAYILGLVGVLKPPFPAVLECTSTQTYSTPFNRAKLLVVNS